LKLAGRGSVAFERASLDATDAAGRAGGAGGAAALTEHERAVRVLGTRDLGAPAGRQRATAGRLTFSRAGDAAAPDARRGCAARDARAAVAALGFPAAPGVVATGPAAADACATAATGPATVAAGPTKASPGARTAVHAIIESDRAVAS